MPLLPGHGNARTELARTLYRHELARTGNVPVPAKIPIKIPGHYMELGG